MFVIGMSIFSFLLLSSSVNQMFHKGWTKNKFECFHDKNNKILYLATKRKNKSYHMKKEEGKGNGWKE